ncbi:MAG: LysR family transcriptional regulator [Sinobacteraceae bacterium]|nr:LysR family transcriptional regulator [Nevskiaceae bacterium]
MQGVRFRIDFNEHCSLGPGKIDLLEAIARTGSLRRAAKELHMSYRRAWLLIDSLNRSFLEPSTTSNVGGAGGGGVEISSFGAELVRRYRIAGRRIEAFARSEFRSLAVKATGAALRKSASRRRRLPKSEPSR